MKILTCYCALIFFASDFAQAQPRGLFFREDWKEIEAALPVSQEHVSNSEIILRLYGPASNLIKKSNHPEIKNDPYYIWSGECKGNWAVGLRHRNNAVDLGGENATVKIRSKQSGFRQLRIILKLDDGTWLVSDQAADPSANWQEREFRIPEIRWRKLDIERITEAGWVDHPDLRKVDEIGFTDLMAGGGTPASSRLDWIEVWGAPVSR